MLSFWRNRAIRNVIMQAAVLGATFAVLGYATYNAAINLKASGIASGFGFMFEKAGYDINFSLIDYSPKTATHLYAWLVGTLNTVFFSILTIVSTTVLALGLAIARLSPNWLLSNVSRAIVEYVRNVPVLVHIFIWYGIYLTLPPIRQSINLSDVAFLSNRGLFLPA
ncbi:MAG: amino acid ABC transporter permease, partial [Hyphomicrobiales bacterium]|nr:amino acid ABC transporter permease [Hyphomicrobiales bacterium]